MKKIADFFRGILVDVIVALLVTAISSLVVFLLLTIPKLSKYKVQVLTVALAVFIVAYFMTWILLKRRIRLYENSIGDMNSIELIQRISKECSARFKISQQQPSTERRISEFFNEARSVDRQVINDANTAIEKVLRKNIFSNGLGFELKYYILDKNLSFHKSNIPSESRLKEYHYSLFGVNENFNETHIQLNNKMRACIISDNDFFELEKIKYYPLKSRSYSDGKELQEIYGFLAIKVNKFASKDIKSLLDKICIEKTQIMVYYLKELSVLAEIYLDDETSEEFDFLEELTARRFK